MISSARSRSHARGTARSLLALSRELHELARGQLAALSSASVATDPDFYPWAAIVELSHDVASYAEIYAERGVLPDLGRIAPGLLDTKRFLAWCGDHGAAYPLVIAKLAVVEELRRVLLDEEARSRLRP